MLQILAGLTLLQAALILFFAGLIVFLLDLNSSVAFPAIGLTEVTLLFLVATTILLTLQAFWLLNARRPTSLPTQCSYKVTPVLDVPAAHIIMDHSSNSQWI